MGDGRHGEWTPNAAAHRRWMVAAGFDVVGEGRMSFQPFGPSGKGKPSARRLVQPGLWRMAFGENLFGTPSGWFEAVPRSDPKCPRSDSNRHCPGLKSGATANWATGADRV